MATVRAGGGLNVTGSPHNPTEDEGAESTGREVVGRGTDIPEIVVIANIGCSGTPYGTKLHPR